MAKVQSGGEILPKTSTPLSRAHERIEIIIYVNGMNVTDDRRIRDSRDPNVA